MNRAFLGLVICIAELMTACGRVGSDSSLHFSLVGTMAQAQFMHSSTLLPDGRVLNICGISGARTALQTKRNYSIRRQRHFAASRWTRECFAPEHSCGMEKCWW